MLVISRRRGQSVDLIVPHDDGSETVLRLGVSEIEGRLVRLFFDLPEEVRLLRTEVARRG